MLSYMAIGVLGKCTWSLLLSEPRVKRLQWRHACSLVKGRISRLTHFTVTSPLLISIPWAQENMTSIGRNFQKHSTMLGKWSQQIQLMIRVRIQSRLQVAVGWSVFYSVWKAATTIGVDGCALNCALRDNYKWSQYEAQDISILPPLY